MLNFENSLKAWEGINELFINPSSDFIKEHNGIIYARAMYLYNVSVFIENPTLDPKFDFGRKFNYSPHKWGSLLGNYINITELKSLKQEILETSDKKKYYNISYNFNNAHKIGKKCLLSMCITRRYNEVVPYITLYLRASEVTKRLAVDLLLIQRIGEYLLDSKPFKLILNINQLFNDDTVLLMYGSHKPLDKMLKNGSDRSYTLYKRYQEMLEGKEEAFKKYKVHWRAFKVLRPDLYSYPTTLAKDCILPL